MDFSTYKKCSFAFCLCIGFSIALLVIMYLEAVPENHLYIKDKYSPTQVNQFTHFIDVKSLLLFKLIENHVCYLTYHMCHDSELFKLSYLLTSLKYIWINNIEKYINKNLLLSCQSNLFIK